MSFTEKIVVGKFSGKVMHSGKVMLDCTLFLRKLPLKSCFFIFASSCIIWPCVPSNPVQMVEWYSRYQNTMSNSHKVIYISIDGNFILSAHKITVPKQLHKTTPLAIDKMMSKYPSCIPLVC